MYPTSLYLGIHRLSLPWGQKMFAQETSPSPTLWLMSVFSLAFVDVELENIGDNPFVFSAWV